MSDQSSALQIGEADPLAADVRVLIDAHVARSRKYYPPESCHNLGPEAIQAEGVRLFVGRIGGEPVVMAGLKPLGDSTGELKSMHTMKFWRGRGFGRALILRIMAEAEDMGLSALFLETGSDEASAAARALYERLGFALCPPFGSYVEDPLSVFMRRPLRRTIRSDPLH